MKTLILSDIHVDEHFRYAVKTSRLPYNEEPKIDVVFDTLDYLWQQHSVPETDAIIIPGDLSNDFLTFTRIVEWLSHNYRETFIVPGNHDLIVCGASLSNSNSRFATSEAKLDAMDDACAKHNNVHFLNGKIVNCVAGCMGMSDFLCGTPLVGDEKIRRWRNWFDGKHWRYFGQDLDKICAYYNELLLKICAEKPKIVITHFAPFQVGVNQKFASSNSNVMFYFDAEKYMDMLDDKTIWACGHIHDKKDATYYNAEQKEIRILCNPLGYPGENANMADVLVYPKREGRLVRKNEVRGMDNYVIDL